MRIIHFGVFSILAMLQAIHFSMKSQTDQTYALLMTATLHFIVGTQP